MTEIYEPTGFALEIFKQRYALHEHETWEEACDRVASHVAAAEHGDELSKCKLEFSEILKKNLFCPGGRIWYGCGRPKGQLLNCFVIPTSDSREGWGKTVYDMIVICGTGGGVGTNFSPIRPRGSSINGSGGTATGAVSLMQVVDAAGNVIKAGGGRRTALMFGLSLTHGDIVEFLDKKLDRHELNCANVSIVLDEDPEDFFEKVKRDDDLELKFHGRVVGKISAKELWFKIVDNSLKCGEPGLMNLYYMNRMSNVWYVGQIICTNPCGEIGLSAYESCCLGSLVLPRFVKNGKIDWHLLKSTVTRAVRFLDDVLTVNNYPLPEIKETCSSLRRIGLGVMGLHDMLLLVGLKYSSDEGLEFVDKVMNYVKNYAYEASAELAVEKGAFAKFDPTLFMKSGFMKTLKPSIRTLVAEKGIRNCAMLTIAPTGTTSIVSNVTSGIEPMFAVGYRQRYHQEDEPFVEKIVLHPLFKQFIDEGRDVTHFEGTFDLTIRNHLEMQRTCQRHIDNACSKTINVKQGTSRDELSDLFMEFLPELKGVTVYPDGSRENQPLTPIPFDDAVALARGVVTLEAYAQSPCRSGKCDL